MLGISKALIVFSEREVAFGKENVNLMGRKFLLGPQIAIIKIINFKETPMRCEQIEKNQPYSGPVSTIVSLAKSKAQLC